MGYIQLQEMDCFIQTMDHLGSLQLVVMEYNNEIQSVVQRMSFSKIWFKHRPWNWYIPIVSFIKEVKFGMP